MVTYCVKHFQELTTLKIDVYTNSSLKPQVIFENMKKCSQLQSTKWVLESHFLFAGETTPTSRILGDRSSIAYIKYSDSI